MKLWQLKRHWEALARDDPFWAVLTESEKQGNRWALDEFYATGVAEVEKDMAFVCARVAPMPVYHALDFGCGAGRLTLGLAPHFERVTGVDISARMVGLAREHSREPKVTFVQNTRPDLALFPDASFDFVYSRITLQHIAPRYTRGYLREFVRILRPGGVMSVQIPEKVPDGDPPDRLRFSVWPPTMAMRISRYVRYHHPGWFPGTPKMQMYALRQDEVLSLLESAGAKLVAVEASAHGAVANHVYVAQRAEA